MNNQEMQFADPEWRPPQQGNVNTDPHELEPYIPQPINTDSREQPQQQTPLPKQERVYAGPDFYADPQAEKIGVGQYAQPPRRRRSRWLWLIVVLIAFAFMGRIATPFYSPPHGEPALKSISFLVRVHPTIVIHYNATGTINVHTGSADTVTINLAQNASGINYDQNQDSNTISVTIDGMGDSDVTVPSNADLQLDSGEGEIDVTGVSGQMSLSSNGGVINATNDSLSGQSTFSSTGGNITFNGSINPHGTYQFTSTEGSINVILPGNSSFHVNARTTTGSISSDFPEVNIHPDDSGADAHGDVGSPPRATVTLNTTIGSISLNKQ